VRLDRGSGDLVEGMGEREWRLGGFKTVDRAILEGVTSR
jgi:hypothetical protein